MTIKKFIKGENMNEKKTLTLTHNGVIFQEPFTSKGFNIINGESISLLAEEMLWKYAPYCFNKYKNNELFIKNVWRDLKPQLPPKLQELEFPKDFVKTLLKMQLVAENLKLKKSEYNKT